jgi:putative phosphoesterase
MLIACFSDPHGNLPALSAAVADARGKGAEQMVCAGDMTGYGPFPDDVCKFLKKQAIPAIVGNYDRKVIDVARGGKSAAAGMNPKKSRILLWTVDHMSSASLKYLKDLPEHLELQLEGGHKILVVHGSPVSADDAIYPSITRQGLEAKLRDVRPDVLLCGHTHIPFVKLLSGILVINCSSVGHPVDGDPRPAYAMIRADEGAQPHGHIIRFDYDREQTIAALGKTSLPKALRRDFAEGNKRRFLQ